MNIINIIKNYINSSSLNIFKNKNLNLEIIYNDPWPGDQNIGSLFLQGKIFICNNYLSLNDFISNIHNPKSLEKEASLYIHSFEWIRNLRCITDNTSRKLVRNTINEWLDSDQKNNKAHKKISWDPIVTSKRVENWVRFFDFYGASADDTFLKYFKESIIDQIDFLNKKKTYTKDPLHKIFILKTLIITSTLFKKNLAQLNENLKQFELELSKQIYPDGGHKSLDPCIHLYVLKDVIDIRSYIRQNFKDEPEFLTKYIRLMIPILRLFRHGDGLLSELKTEYFSFFPTPSATLVDMVLSLADIKGRPANKAPDMGYERINIKSSQVILNTKPHNGISSFVGGPGCGILNFEWSLGKFRMVNFADIVIQHEPNQWIQTSTNLKNPKVLKTNKSSKSGYCFLEADFESAIPIDKYSSSSVIMNFKRQLYISNEYDFRGEERLLLSENALIGIRFVLPKNTDISSVKKGQNYQTVIKFHNDSNNTHKKGFHALWRFMTTPCEDLLIQKDEENNKKIILIIHSIKKDKPKVVKWAFHPIN